MEIQIVNALIISGGAILVALTNILPQLRTRKDVKYISKKVDDLSTYIKNEKDDNEVRAKMHDVQMYYVNKINQLFKHVAIMKSESFIELVVDNGLTLDFNNINHYQAYQDHLFSGSQYCKIKMEQTIGKDLTEKYYSTHEINTQRYNIVIQKIFFTTDNSKRAKFISASIDFMQLFMNEIMCLTNNNDSKKNLLNECGLKSRRIEDHK
jgi:hypothetical protein